LQAQIFMLDFQAARYLVEGEVAEQAGNNHPTTIPTSAFKTRDGYINIATTGGKMWERFCQALGAPDMPQNPDYQTAGARLKHRDALNAEIETYLESRDSADWVAHFNDAGVPCGPIYAIDKMFADPQVQHLKMAQTVDGKGKSKPKSKSKSGSKSPLTLVGQPISLSRTPSHLVAPPPKLGEHTDSILKEFGFSKREIKALHKAGAV
jgi:crotonobetainyl-CoA:carnitine CoA-transferase CaiB-like acyl-CoA transferase